MNNGSVVRRGSPWDSIQMVYQESNRAIIDWILAATAAGNQPCKDRVLHEWTHHFRFRRLRDGSTSGKEADLTIRWTFSSSGHFHDRILCELCRSFEWLKNLEIFHLIYYWNGQVWGSESLSMIDMATLNEYDINSLRPRQIRRHFADDIFKGIFLNENVWIPIKISLKFVPKGPINNIPALVQIVAWRRPGDKPLSEPMNVE